VDDRSDWALRLRTHQLGIERTAFDQRDLSIRSQPGVQLVVCKPTSLLDGVIQCLVDGKTNLPSTVNQA